MRVLGQMLIDAAKLSRREVVLIAPFVKADALSLILECVPGPVNSNKGCCEMDTHRNRSRRLRLGNL